MIAKKLAEISRAKALRKTLVIDGTETVYFEYPAENQNAKTILMIHGYRGNHHGLESIAGGLGQFRILIPDLPGFGESGPLKREHSVAGYVKWLEGFVAELGLTDELHLVGHSFGTLVVGKYASNHKVTSVSLINPVSAPALSGPRAIMTTLARIYYLIGAFAPSFAGEWLLRNKTAVMVMSIVMTKTKDRSLRRWIHDQHIANFSNFASRQVANEGFQASISTDLSKLAAAITSPVLIVAADLDDITDISTQKKVAELYPRAILREIHSVGHLVHYEAPDLAAQYISEFVGGLK